MIDAGLLDTSILIASESGRPLDASKLPERGYLSVISLGELAAGVHAAKDTVTRARRLRTLTSASGIAALPVDGDAAQAWAVLRVGLHDLDRAVKANDLWIAAVAYANDLPVVTQDGDFEPLRELGLEVVRA